MFSMPASLKKVLVPSPLQFFKYESPAGKFYPFLQGERFPGPVAKRGGLDAAGLGNLAEEIVNKKNDHGRNRPFIQRLGTAGYGSFPPQASVAFNRVRND
jgi:hypothetical protein